MDTLLARLTDLAYEFFGILLPGVVALFAFMLVWVAAGEIASSQQLVPLGGAVAKTWEAMKEGGELPLSWAIPALAIAYFVGHLLKYISKQWWWCLNPNRKRPASLPSEVVEPTTSQVGGASSTGPSQTSPWYARLRQWLLRQWLLKKLGSAAAATLSASRWLLIAPRQPKDNYPPSMQKLFEKVVQAYQARGEYSGDLKWTGFFPVARACVMQRGRKSLLMTFQNNYTLHRSLATLSTICAWAGIVLLAYSSATLLLPLGVQAKGHGVGLLAVVLVALVAKQVFTVNYEYSWSKWGEHVIAEAYALEIDRSPDSSIDSGDT